MADPSRFVGSSSAPHQDGQPQRLHRGCVAGWHHHDARSLVLVL